jgi:formylglycine-generating enzyme required for sulfatase activity
MFKKEIHLFIILLAVFCLNQSHAQDDSTKAIKVETSPGKRFDQGHKWAILIGINKYLDSKISSLDYCVSDVRLMEQVLIKQSGYEQKRILVISDDQKEDHLQPLFFNLSEQIRNWLLNMKEKDTVLVYFSGHGFLDGNMQGYLAPKDCRKSNLSLTAFRTNELKNMLQSCKASQKLLILDCCHAGGNKGDENATSSEEVASTFKKAKGLITLASCQKKQLSREWKEKKQGLFTYYLAEGLGGKADKDSDGIVDSDEIYKYVFDNVPLTAQRKLNSVQTPVRIIGEDVVGIFGLARVSVKPAPVMKPGEISVHFTVRAIAEKDKTGKPASGVRVELLYRYSPDSRPDVLETVTTGEDGTGKMTVKLTAVQQFRGEFMAMVSHGSHNQVWSLARFPSVKSFNLTVPLSVQPDLINAPFSKKEAEAKQTAWAKHLKVDVDKTNSIGMKFKLIPAGEFEMGSGKSAEEIAKLFNMKALYYTREHPQHNVRITKPFYMGVHEVTQKQWESVMNTTPWEGKDYVKEGDDYAATYVNWEDAQEFLKKLNKKEGTTYRLPTEAEWEYACRAGSESMFCFGESTETLKEYAWFDDNANDVGEKYAHRVGLKKSNGFGLFDMHGNVYEWCSDWYDEDYYKLLASKLTENPRGASFGKYRVLRGGSWLYLVVDVRSSTRLRNTPDIRNSNSGFRLVRTP